MGIYTLPSQNAMQTTLGGNLALGETGSLTLAADWSSYLSTASATRPFVLVIDRVNASGTKTPTVREYIKCTGISGTTVSGLTRGRYGSTDQAHTAGAIVELVMDAETLQSIIDTFDVDHSLTTGAHTLTQLLDTNGNETIKTPATTSAVNEITITNAATGNGPTISATGGDDNIDLNLAAKGTGSVKVGGSAIVPTTRFLLTPLSATFPATNYPQLLKNVGTNKVDFTLDYDKTTSETAEWEMVLPVGMTVNTATLYVTFRMASVTSGNVAWDCITKSNAEGEAWDASGTTDSFTAETVQGTAGMVCQVSKALTTTGWAAGETLHLKVSRNVAGDDANEDAKFMSALLIIT